MGYCVPFVLWVLCWLAPLLGRQGADGGDRVAAWRTRLWREGYSSSSVDTVTVIPGSSFPPFVLSVRCQGLPERASDLRPGCVLTEWGRCL